MKWTVAAVLGLAACGGSDNSSNNGTDYAAAYVANWTGDATIFVQGNSVTAQILVPVQETTTNVIELQGFCSDSDSYADGPLADVTGTGYTLRADSCSWSSSACGSGNLGLSWASGSGALNSDQLTGSISGSLTCVGQSLSYMLTFNSTAKGTYGTFRTHDGKGLAEAIRMLAQ